ncbi:glycosyltransferase family 4 protein [Candidatus Sumerlaeota bacterium]|nr:glycosyltransferase family 4 protein [Candidatus Sumerlaeota bacterium]
MRPFRILHLSSSERWTGPAEPIVSLAREQQRRGHEVWLACVPGQSFERRARHQGLRTLSQFHLDRRLNPLRFLGDLRSTRLFVRANQVEIVHCHLLHDNWIAALALMGLRKPPLLARTFHRWELPRGDIAHRWLFGWRNDLTITTSRSLLALFDGRIALRGGATAVIYGGVDCERFNPDRCGLALREELGISPSAPVAGIVARMTVGRGHRWLLNAAPAVVRHMPQARILLIGRGPLKKPLRAEINSTRLRENVALAGYRRADLPEAYAALDVALFLGMGSEGTCRAALEAMATGRPVIAHRAGALPEIVEDGKTGLLVEPDDADALADAIVRLLGDPHERERMGRAARQAVLERFTEAHRAEATLAAYRAVWQARCDQASGLGE